MFLGQEGGGAPETLYVEDVFSSYPYIGTGAARSISNGINLSGRGGLLWIKTRGSTDHHCLFDTARGDDSRLISNSNNAVDTGWGTYLDFNADGFGFPVNNNNFNQSGALFSSWTFRKAAKFFDVVTYTGNGANRTISHNLGVAPGMIIVKCTNLGTTDWRVYHRSITNAQYLTLNTTATTGTDGTCWNSTTATASDFSVGTNTDINASGRTYVAYLFAHDTSSDGIIQCGNFTGASSTINLGWEPQYILLKNMTSGGYNWVVYDTARGLTLGNDAELNPNVSNAEWFGMSTITPLATGFSTASIGPTGDTYVYMAIRKGLMRPPTDATKVFAISARSGTSAAATVSAGGITQGVDIVFAAPRNSGGHKSWHDRLRGPASQISSINTSSEVNYSDEITSFDMNGITVGASASGNMINFSSYTYINYMWKEARGYCNKVHYVGTGSAHTEAHNLGVVPELWISKPVSTSGEWRVFFNFTGSGYDVAYLEQNVAKDAHTYSTGFLTGQPTASGLLLNTNSNVNGNGNRYINYLFASVPGVSKIGTYTGNATTNQINCGFTAGARFVLIKRIDGTGDWYFFDTTRGIVSGTDPYLLMNSSSAESNADYIDPYSAGFELNGTMGTPVNANTAIYLYLAIA